MLVKRIAACIPIYIQQFTSYSEILVENQKTFSYPLHLMPPLGVFPLEFRDKFGPQKTTIGRSQAVKTV